MMSFKVYIRVLAIVLIITIGVIIVYYLGIPEGANISKSNNISRKPANSPVKATSDTVTRGDFIYPADNKRDPFQRLRVDQKPPEVTVKTPSIKLTGVIWNKKNPVAIITDSENNSHFVRIGEKIGETKVIAIQPGSITVEKDGRTQELVLWSKKL